MIYVAGDLVTDVLVEHDGDIRIGSDTDAAIRLETGSSVVSSYDVGDAGLVQDGSTWTSPGFETAAVQIELRAEANAGSFSLNPDDADDGGIHVEPLGKPARDTRQHPIRP